MSLLPGPSRKLIECTAEEAQSREGKGGRRVSYQFVCGASHGEVLGWMRARRLTLAVALEIALEGGLHLGGVVRGGWRRGLGQLAALLGARDWRVRPQNRRDVVGGRGGYGGTAGEAHAQRGGTSERERAGEVVECMRG